MIEDSTKEFQELRRALEQANMNIKKCTRDLGRANMNNFIVGLVACGVFFALALFALWITYFE